MAFARTAAVAGAGTVSCTGTTTVTGTGTAFAFGFGSIPTGTQARVGGTITVGANTRTIVAINSATSLVTDTAFPTFTAQAFTVQTGITQTGTDTMNLSLGSVAGMTITNRADLYRTFDAQGNDLTINGICTVLSSVAQLRNDGSCNNRLTVVGSASGGELIFNGRISTAGDGPIPYAGLDWLGTNGMGGATALNSTNASFPAKLTLIDACVRFGGDWFTVSAGNFARITTQGDECWILCAKGTGTTQARIRLNNNTPVLDFQAKQTWAGTWLNFGAPQVSLKGFTPIFTDGPEINVDSIPVVSRIPIEDYNTSYIQAAYYPGSQLVMYGGAWTRLKNNLLGTNIVWRAVNSASNRQNIVEFSKQVKATSKDAAGNLLSDGYFYFTPIGSNTAGIRPKGVTTDVTFDLAQKAIQTVSGSAETEFVYAWDFSALDGGQNIYNYFCSGQTKGAETHPAFVTRYGYDTQPVTLVLSGNGTYEAPTTHASLPTSDKLIANAAALTGVTFNFPAKTWTNALGSTRTVQEIYDVYQLQRNQPANLGVADDCVVSGTLRNWVGWTGINNGTITGGAADLKLGLNVISGTGTITALYQIGGIPSARLTTTGLTASSLAVIDNTGASYDFASGLTGSRSAYFDPGKTGTWTAIAERLGYKRQTFTFTPGSGGDFAFAPLWIPDTSLIVTDPAVSSGYTLVQDQNKTLDRIAYERTTAEGIAVDKAFKDGTYLNWGNADVLFVASAADPVVYDAALNKFTVAVGATRIPGSTMYGDRTTGRITAGAGVTIMSAFVDADGLRVLVSGLDAQAFGITWNLRYKLHTASTWTVLSGTGNSTTILMTEALYDVQVRVPGYDWKTTSIDTAKTQALDLLLNYQTTSTGQPQYTQPFDAVIEASFNYDATAMKVAVSNTGGALIYPSFNDVYRAIQRIMHISSLVWQWSNPVTYNSQAQKVIIPTGNPISMYLTEASNASVILTCQVVHEASGASAEDRVKGNSSGFFIKLGNQATADSASIATTIIGQLGGPNFVSGTHGLSVIKDTIGTVNTNVLAVPAAVWANPVRTLTSAGASGATLAEIEASTVLAKEATAAAIKAKTDNLPAAPAAVGSAMTLTGAYDAAKTAATQTSVDTLSTDLDTLDQLVQALPTLLEIEASTTLAKAADVSAVPTAVRTELFTELARIDDTISSRSTLTAGDIPAGLTATEVWAAPARTLTEAPGLTTGQAEQLRKVAQLHGVGAQLVVTETTRTAGDVSQTLTTDDDGNTTVSAA